MGKLCKMHLFPYLLWYVTPMHLYYPHEWEYVLFLLRSYNKNETIKEH